MGLPFGKSNKSMKLFQRGFAYTECWSVMKLGVWRLIKLVDASQFQGAIAKRRDSGLKVDKSASGRKRLIVEGHVETERAEWEDIENRLLTPRFTRHRHGENEESNPKT